MYLYCDKIEQRRHFKVCLKLQCKHLVESEGVYTCGFVNTQNLRAAKREARVEVKRNDEAKTL